MKRILSLLLCLLITCSVFSGCSESNLDQFRDDLDEYKNVELPRDREEVTLDFYIIYEDGTTENAMETVQSYINSHLSSYKTVLDMHYLTAAEYEAEVKAAASAEGEDRADIVLVVGKAMFDSFYNDNLLADITTYYSSNTYGLLNTIISSTLLKSALVSVPSFEGNQQYNSLRYFTVPNNHVIGEYEYILIDKDAARYYNYSNRDLAAMVTYESTLELREKLGERADECVKQVTGTYDDKAVYESQGFLCNVAAYPIGDAEEAFKSSFAIVRHPLDTRYKEAEDKISIESQKTYNAHYDRCMEIIYALNTDVVFRNLLQYGHLGTNYSFDEETNTVTKYAEGAGVYNMNLLYTGDVFKAYYCSELGWTKEADNNGINQNKEAVLPVVE